MYPSPQRVAQRYLRARKKDPESRQKAEHLYAKLLSFMESIKRTPGSAPVYFNWRPGGELVAYTHARHVDPADESLQDLYVGFDITAKGKTSFFSPNYPGFEGKGYIQVRPLFAMEARWTRGGLIDIAPVFSNILKSRRGALIHELTHYFDWKRLEEVAFTKAYGGRYEGDKDIYYNSGLEMNAYFQQGTASFWEQYQRETKNGSSSFGLVNYLSMDWDTFWDKFYPEHTSMPMWKHLTPKNTRSQKKRLAQFLLHVRKDAAKHYKPFLVQKLAEARALAAQGDEDAIEWDLPIALEQRKLLRSLGVSVR